MNGGKLSDRSTTDLIVIFLTAVVGFVLVGVMLATMLSILRNPKQDVTNSIRFMTTATTSLITGVIGYIGGRATARFDNGNSKPTVKPPDQQGWIDPGVALLLLAMTAYLVLLIRAV